MYHMFGKHEVPNRESLATMVDPGNHSEYNLWNMNIVSHYSDVVMSPMASPITSLTIIYSTVIQAQIKEKIKRPRHWHLGGEFTGDRWIPRTKGQ